MAKPQQLALTPTEQQIIEDAWDKRNPSIFLNYFLKPADGGFLVGPGSVRHTQYLRHWTQMDRPKSFTAESGEIQFEVSVRFGDFSEFVKGIPGDFVTNVAFFEHRGYVLLPWALKEYRATQPRVITIGTPGTGKTLNRGLCAMFECATIPFYRFLNIAPTVYQSNVMVRELRQRIVGTLFEKKFLLPGIKGYKIKPFAMYSFQIESSAEFMNVARNADNIQGWRGDKINFDEAGLANGDNDAGGVELADMLPGIVSRMTGVRPDGKPRAGKLGLISMAYDNDALWQLYDYGFLPETQSQYYSTLIRKEDNPYITPKQWADIVNDVERNVPAGLQRAWLYGERPAKAGAEFPAPLIDGMFSEDQMTKAQQDPDTVIETSKHGIWIYQEQYRKNHQYIMSGDPGLGEPPFRNAPCVQVWDVTNFPDERARLTGFWWGYSGGSIMPFLTQFDKWTDHFHIPNNCRAYDSTGTQSHLSELAWQSGENPVVPLGFEGSKKWSYLNAAKILLSKGLLMAPKGISGLETQMRHYRLPDRKLAQDTVSTLCMAAFLMFPLYKAAYPEEIDDKESAEAARQLFESGGRTARPISDRYAGHRR